MLGFITCLFIKNKFGIYMTLICLPSSTDNNRLIDDNQYLTLPQHKI